MGNTMIKKVPSNSSVVSYEQLIIADLAELIVGNADRQALDELLSNRILCVKHDEDMNLPKYLQSLKDDKKTELYESVMIQERAYDMTIAKFCNIPEKPNGGPDCRYYYQAFLNYLRPIISGKDFIQQDVIAANKLRWFVYKHYRWSCRDAKRQENGFSKTYQWRNRRMCLRLQMPAIMNGRQCSKWLEDNVGEPDAENLYEKERIQQIIDENLFVPSNIPLDATSFQDFKAQTITPLSQLIANEIKILPLFECIANEKSDNLDFLRVSIARIGKAKVKKLVMAIFDAIINDTYKPSVLGSRFGVSPAAMTRFASIKWSNGNENTVPQLWLNLARYVVNLPQYSKMLYETGLYDKLCSVVQED